MNEMTPATKTVKKKPSAIKINFVKSRGRWCATSIQIAKHFGKRHDNVLRDIAEIDCSEKFRLLNYEESSYLNEQNKNQPMFLITQDGFAFLAFGFKGKEAARVKEHYIEGYNKKSKTKNLNFGDPQWQIARIEGKPARRTFTDILQKLWELAIAQGSKSYADKFNLLCINYTKLFKTMLDDPANPRDLHSTRELTSLKVAEECGADLIESMIERGIHYRDIYKECKIFIFEFKQLLNVKQRKLHGI